VSVHRGRILVHGARQLLTLRGPAEPRRGIDLGQLHIIEDGAVAGIRVVRNPDKLARIDRQLQTLH